MDEITALLIAAAWLVGPVSLIAIVYRLTSPKHARPISFAGWGTKVDVGSAAPSLVEKPKASEGRSADDDQPTEPQEKLSKAADDQPDSAFWTATDLAAELEKWTAFRITDPYKADPEFWTSMHVERRMVLGQPGAREELERLVESEPNWLWPLIFLADEAGQKSDYTRAESLLDRARQREGSEGIREVVLARSIRIRKLSEGVDAAVSFARALFSESSAADRASILFYMADALEDKNPLTKQVFRELSVRSVSNQSRRFDLAYAYEDNEDTASLALRHYAKLSEEDYNNQAVSNNLGVEYKKLGSKNLQIEHYEKAAKDGNALALFNICHELIAAGFFDRAAGIVANVGDFSGHEEDKASLEAKIARAKKDLDDERKNIRESTFKSFDAAQAAFGSFEKFWHSVGDVPWTSGQVYKDRGTTAEMQDSFVAVEANVDGKILSGKLERIGPIAEGWLSEPSASLLGAVRRRCLVLASVEGRLELVILPVSAGSTLAALTLQIIHST